MHVINYRLTFQISLAPCVMSLRRLQLVEESFAGIAKLGGFKETQLSPVKNTRWPNWDKSELRTSSSVANARHEAVCMPLHEVNRNRARRQHRFSSSRLHGEHL